MFKKTLASLLLFFSLGLAAQQQHMTLQEIVTDSARIFSSGQLLDLKEKLTAFETETTNQLAVVTIERLGFETIESYANGLFNQNGLGQEGKDNGLLILFSEQDREVRIEVGYGLEPYITDAVASRIIRNNMIPLFKEEKYYEGVSQSTDQLITFLNNPEALAEFKDEIQRSETRNKWIGYVFLSLFVSLFVGVGGFYFYKSYKSLIETFRGLLIGKIGLLPAIFMIFGMVLSSLFGLLFMIGPVLAGLTTFELVYLPYEELLDQPLLLLWFLVPLFGIALLIAYIKIKFFGKDAFKISLIKNDSTYYRKTFSSSGSHSFGSSSSSSRSSSSFSGGGGSSGGGGASGSW